MAFYFAYLLTFKMAVKEKDRKITNKKKINRCGSHSDNWYR
jgi:hypothetical protein